jgi:hypothetical protein
MSLPTKPEPAKLLIGLFTGDKALFPKVAALLASKIGAVDMVSPWFEFNYTDYYAAEMGESLFRRILVFNDLIEQDRIVDIKLMTNAVEIEYSKNGKRKVNIDPGYLLRERLVLATGKNFSHRIYLGRGIYADLTLIYQKGAFRKLPWTYPDYTAAEMLGYLDKIRSKYVHDLRQLKGKTKID